MNKNIPPAIRDVIVKSAEYPFHKVDAEVKLDQNESSFDFPEGLKDEVCTRIRGLPWNRYPDLHAETLAAAIAEYAGWSPEGVVVTTGSNVLIPLLTVLAGLSASVVTVKPNFALYALGAELLGAKLHEVALSDDLTLDGDAIIRTLHASRQADADGKPGVLYLPQPHAPSGSLASDAVLEEILRAATDWVVVLDEAYFEFAGGVSRNWLAEFQNVIVIRTFSKAWGLAGARLGYALAHPPIASQLRKLVPPFTISVMQSVTALVALENPEYMKERVKDIIAERERMTRALQLHPSWHVYPSKANFLLIRTPSADDAYRLLLDGGVLVRRQDKLYGLEGCLRVTVGSHAENDAFLRAAGC